MEIKKKIKQANKELSRKFSFLGSFLSFSFSMSVELCKIKVKRFFDKMNMDLICQMVYKVEK